MRCSLQVTVAVQLGGKPSGKSITGKIDLKVVPVSGNTYPGLVFPTSAITVTFGTGGGPKRL